VDEVLVPVDEVLVPVDEVLVPVDEVLVPVDEVLVPVDEVLVPVDVVEFDVADVTPDVDVVKEVDVVKDVDVVREVEVDVVKDVALEDDEVVQGAIELPLVVRVLVVSSVLVLHCGSTGLADAPGIRPTAAKPRRPAVKNPALDVRWTLSVSRRCFAEAARRDARFAE